MAVRSWGFLASLAHRCSVLSSTSRAVDSQWTFRISRRSCSGKSSGEEDSADGEAESNVNRNRIEQALKEIRIQSAAPDWLPFFPGGSFWIHPDQIAGKKPQKPSGPLLNPASEREILAMVMPMGWPNSEAVSDAMNPKSDATN